MHHLMASERPFWRNFLLTRKIGTGKKNALSTKGPAQEFSTNTMESNPKEGAKLGTQVYFFLLGNLPSVVT